MSRSPSSPRRALAGAMVAVLVACTLLAGWHHATVLHGRCVEHGEEVHLARVAATPLQQHDAGVASLGASPWTSSGDDDHCEILAAAHLHVAHHVDAIVTIAPPSLDPVLTPALPIVGGAVTVYRLAPKTSPPV